jgi:hypothetical protein
VSEPSSPPGGPPVGAPGGPSVGPTTYADHVGSHFQIIDDNALTGDGCAILVLDRLEVTPSPPGCEQYALFFRGNHDVPLHQKNYRLMHETLGTSDIFLVPVGRSDSSVEYQACFNHPTTTD